MPFLEGTLWKGGELMEWRWIERDKEHLGHPIRGVTLVDGSKVLIDRVTGITCNLEEQLEKVEALNNEVANGLRNIKDFEDRINSVSGILNNIRDKVKGKK